MSSTCNHPIRYIRMLSDRHHAENENDTWLNIRPDFQRDYEQRSSIWIANLLDSILQDRAMPPIWTIYNEVDNSDEVLDGQHRLLTILNFINNEICVKDSHRESLYNKYFRDLSRCDQQKILNFSLSFNKLDGSYKKSPQKLFGMYEILNRSSKPLNKYEVYKPLRLQFYRLLESKLPRFHCFPMFSEKDRKRGRLEMRLIQILAFIDLDVSRRQNMKFQSMEDLKDTWCEKWVGDTDETIDKKLDQHKKYIEENIEKIFSTMARFKELGMFHFHERTTDSSGPVSSSTDASVLCDKKRILLLQMVVGLTIKIMDRDKRAYPEILRLVKGIFVNISAYAGTESRDQKYQKNCLLHLYRDLLDIHRQMETRRCFSKQEIEEKRKEQGNKCAMCFQPMEPFQRVEGDHILPFGNGGLTTMENLRVVHYTCHHGVS